MVWCACFKWSKTFFAFDAQKKEISGVWVEWTGSNGRRQIWNCIYCTCSSNTAKFTNMCEACRRMRDAWCRDNYCYDDEICGPRVVPWIWADKSQEQIRTAGEWKEEEEERKRRRMKRKSMKRMKRRRRRGRSRSRGRKWGGLGRWGGSWWGGRGGGEEEKEGVRVGWRDSGGRKRRRRRRWTRRRKSGGRKRSRNRKSGGGGEGRGLIISEMKEKGKFLLIGSYWQEIIQFGRFERVLRMKLEEYSSILRFGWKHP